MSKIYMLSIFIVSLFCAIQSIESAETTDSVKLSRARELIQEIIEDNDSKKNLILPTDNSHTSKSPHVLDFSKSLPKDLKNKLIAENISPTTTLTNAEGMTRKLSDYQGQVILLHFWATWCPPCLKEFKNLRELKNKLLSKPFEIIAISHDFDVQDMEDFLKESKPNFPIYFDPFTKIIDGIYPNSIGLPISILVDKSGKYRYVYVGAQEWMQANTQRNIDGLINSIY